MGPIVPSDPGAPGFPGGPAGPGRLQTSWEEWTVKLWPLLDEELVDCDMTTDNAQIIAHTWNMMDTVKSQEEKAQKVFTIFLLHICA